MVTSRRRMLALSGAVLAGVAGCVAAPERGPSATLDVDAADRRVDPDVGDAQLETLVDANARFAFELYDALVDDDPENDHFVSPISVSTALAMTWAGARGETEAAMADALQFPFEQDDLHPAMNALERELTERGEDDGVELHVANALWPHEGVDLREEFLDTTERHYGARPAPLDFAGDPEGARETINDWVADETEGTIDELIPESGIGSRTTLVLTNAIYFLGKWAEEFDEGDTADATFTALDGTTSTVRMMSQTESFPYAAVAGHQLIELPYEGDRTSLVVILPEEGRFESFESSLNADRLDELLGELEEQHGTIELPRFELETSYELSEQLRELGAERAFSSADFSGMFEEGNAAISKVFHDAFVAVDEEGTEAGAATAVAMNTSAPVQSFEMTVDRPFLVALRDRPTGAVLFLGRVVDVPDDP